MSIIKFKSKKIHHVHIPRCGGKYICNLFLANSITPTQWEVQSWPPFEYFTRIELEDEDNLQFQWEEYRGIKIQLIHREYYEEMSEFDNCTHKFAVVRDPWKRFISCLGMVCCLPSNDYNLHRVLEMISEKEGFDKFMSMATKSFGYQTNILRPQHEFLTEDALLWRFEDGFDEPFIDWINENFNIKLIGKDSEGNPVVNVADIENGEMGYMKKEEEMAKAAIPDTLEGFVREYYAKDYELLGY